MKNSRFTHILSIMFLALIFAFTMAISVMADDIDSKDASADNAAAELVSEADEDTEDADDVVEESDDDIYGAEDDTDDAEVIEDNDSNDPEVIDVNDDDEGSDVENVDVNAEDDSDIADADDEQAADDEEIEQVGSIEPEDSEDDDRDDLGVVGDASSYNPVTREITVYKADGSVEILTEADEDLGVVGDASSYDPITGKTTVYKADGSVEVYSDNNSSYSYQTAAAVSSDTFVPVPALSEEKAETVETVIAPAAEAEESAVLGDYEEPESNSIPFTAGIAFFSSTLVGLGVLWKLGLIAL